MHVRWDERAAAKPHGQLVFFAEFLAATGVFERWVSGCPRAYCRLTTSLGYSENDAIARNPGVPQSDRPYQHSRPS